MQGDPEWNANLGQNFEHRGLKYRHKQQYAYSLIDW